MLEKATSIVLEVLDFAGEKLVPVLAKKCESAGRIQIPQNSNRQLCVALNMRFVRDAQNQVCSTVTSGFLDGSETVRNRHGQLSLMMSQPTLHDLENAAFHPSRCVGGLVENASHMAISLGRAVTIRPSVLC
jgi:hypothetical protein